MLQRYINLPDYKKTDFNKFEKELTAILKNSKQQINHILLAEPKGNQDVLYALENIEDRIHNCWKPIDHLYSVKSILAFRDTYSRCLHKVTRYFTEFNQNKKIYNLFVRLHKKSVQFGYSKAQKQYIKNTLLEFRLSGVSLSTNDKNKFKNLDKRHTKLMHKFQENVLDSTQEFKLVVSDRSELKGLPPLMIARAKKIAHENKQKNYVLTLDLPSYLAVIRYAEDRFLRGKIYYAYVTRGSSNEVHNKKFNNSKIIEQILYVRSRMAELLGFDNYAEYSSQTKMLTTRSVMKFLSALVVKCKSKYKKEYEMLSEFGKQFGIDEIQAWDLEYLREQYRKQYHAL